MIQCFFLVAAKPPEEESLQQPCIAAVEFRKGFLIVLPTDTLHKLPVGKRLIINEKCYHCLSPNRLKYVCFSSFDSDVLATAALRYRVRRLACNVSPACL